MAKRLLEARPPATGLGIRISRSLGVSRRVDSRETLLACSKSDLAVTRLGSLPALLPASHAATHLAAEPHPEMGGVGAPTSGCQHGLR